MSPAGKTFEPLRLTLRDGSEVTLRAIRASDAENLQETIRALSDESRYTRFFSPMRELSPSLLERATQPDAKRELQLVAVAGEGSDERIVAGTRFTATETDGDCEFAIAISDDWQGRGLARHLLENLIRAATDHGFVRMEGLVLADNEAMLGLAKSLGFEKFPSSEGPTVCLVRRPLQQPA